MFYIEVNFNPVCLIFPTIHSFNFKHKFHIFSSIIGECSHHCCHQFCIINFSNSDDDIFWNRWRIWKFYEYPNLRILLYWYSIFHNSLFPKWIEFSIVEYILFCWIIMILSYVWFLRNKKQSWIYVSCKYKKNENVSPITSRLYIRRFSWETCFYLQNLKWSEMRHIIKCR